MFFNTSPVNTREFFANFWSSTVADWGAVPEYSAALDQALGSDALQRLDTEAAQQMTGFNSISRSLYDNLMARVKV